MITITPIKLNNSHYKTQTNYKNSPVLVSKVDSFEHAPKNVSFGNKVDLHFPVQEVEELFTNAHQAIVKEPDINKKAKLTRECINEFKLLKEKISETWAEEEETWNFNCDREHEIVNPMLRFCNFILMGKIELRNSKNLPLDITPEEYNESFKSMFESAIAVVKKFNLFIDKGLQGSTMPLKEIFEIALTSAQKNAKDKNVRINVHGEKSLDKYLQGSSINNKGVSDYKLYTIFANLIQNAVKYTAKDSSIDIKLKKQKINEKTYLIFSVKDKGIGFPKTEQEQILLRGGRASNAIESGIEGTGYGLNRVKRILDKANNTNSKKLEDCFIKIKSPANPFSKKHPGSEISALIELEN